MLGLVQLVIATALSTKDQGLPYNLGPRDCRRRRCGPERAPAARLRNFRETFVLFAVSVLVMTVAGQDQVPTTALGAQLYFWARLIYVPIYAAGIPVLRTLYGRSRCRAGRWC